MIYKEKSEILSKLEIYGKNILKNEEGV